MAKRKKNVNYLRFALVLLPVIFLLFFSINISMREVKNTTSLHEEDLSAMQELSLTSDKQKGATSKKEQLLTPWEPESQIAQRIEQVINLKNSSDLSSALNNYEKNLKYNRNKAAVMFYLAYGYERLGNLKKAKSFYTQIIANFYNDQILLYIIDSPLYAAKNKIYSVSIYEEALLRKAIMLNSTPSLKSLTYSNKKFGVNKKELFLYSALAKYNLYRKQKEIEFISSSQQFIRLSLAQKHVQDFIAACYDPKKDLSEYFTEMLQPNANVFHTKFKNLENQSLDFKFKNLIKTGFIYYYTYQTKDAMIILDVVDDGSTILIKNIIFK
ncbi:hypothetical protein OAR19_00470 [bacterium]|nr:hypothetical protein [bacterium]